MALSNEQKTKMWAMLNQTRGQIGLTAYKDYIFGILFYKYLSEKAMRWLESTLRRNETWESIYAQDSVKSLSYMGKNLGYAIQPGDFFVDWKKAIDEDQFSIGMMSETFGHFNQQIAPDAKRDFEGIFDGMRFDSADLGANAQARASVMISMIDLLSTPEFDLSASDDTVSDIYEYLVAQFATVLASDMGQYYTPQEISAVMAQILTHGREDKERFSIYDPTVGSGSLLLTTASYMKNSDKRGMIKYYGQEKDATPFRLARMNFWNSKDREDDPRWREYGVAPKTKADYAFLLHCLYHLEDDGKMAIVLPHGVLFRGAAEGRIRKALLEKHQIETIIGFPDKMFLNTSIPVCVLILSKNRVESDVLFVDASERYEKLKKQNRLRPEDITNIVEAVVERKEIEKFSHVATLEEIKENDYNLNIPRYVDTFEEEEPIDMIELSNELVSLNSEIKKTEQEFLSMLDELAETPETKAIIEATKAVFK